MLRNRFETLAHLARSLILKYVNISMTISSGRTLNPPWVFLCIFLQMFPISRLHHIPFLEMHDFDITFFTYPSGQCINSWYYHQLVKRRLFPDFLAFLCAHILHIGLCQRLRESVSSVPICRWAEIKTSFYLLTR